MKRIDIAKLVSVIVLRREERERTKRNGQILTIQRVTERYMSENENERERK